MDFARPIEAIENAAEGGVSRLLRRDGFGPPDAAIVIGGSVSPLQNRATLAPKLSCAAGRAVRSDRATRFPCPNSCATPI
jgi:hypothetical protein